jgi:hypothetical protein
MLGSVWFTMGDLPQAGRHWWLTERKGEDADVARDAFYSRFGSDARSVLRALPRPARPEHYPEGVRVRLEELVTAVNADDIGWTPWNWKPIQRDRPDLADHPESDRLGAFVALLVLGTVVALILVGFVTVISWLVELVT